MKISLYSKIKEKLQIFARKLAKPSVFVYFSGYLFLIILFSIVYNLLPHGSFYQPTSKYEYSDLNPEADNIRNMIKQILTNNFLHKYGSTKAVINDWIIDANSLSVHSFNIKEFPNGFSFEIRLPMSTVTTPMIYSMSGAEINVSCKGKNIMDDMILLYSSIKQTITKETGIVALDSMPVISGMFLDNRAGVSNGNNQTNCYIGFSKDLYARIVYFGNGYLGFPDKLHGQYLRMLYFSFGIATSNTFGDIVPITNTARSLVVAESFFMIIFVGLMLNIVIIKVNQYSNPKRRIKK